MGAEGNQSNSTYVGGKGGYTSGIIYLNSGEELEVYVGSKGGASDTIGTLFSGGSNGGGDGYGRAGSGGGATDVRYGGASLNDRIMVAGGGGGAVYYANNNASAAGGAGGGLIGKSSILYVGSWGSPAIAPTGGSQTSGEIAGKTNSTGINGANGSFGIGAGIEAGTVSANNYIPGGGGGYYGGGNGRYMGGAGGSSYISGYAGVVSVETSEDAGDASGNRAHPNNTTKHYSGGYFFDGEMQTGIRSGDGLAKITYLGLSKPTRNNKLNNVQYIEDCVTGSSANGYGHWNEIQAIYKGINVVRDIVPREKNNLEAQSTNPYDLATDGDITTFSSTLNNEQGVNKCLIVDLGAEYDLDEIAIWHYWADGRTYNNNITSVAGADGVYRTLISPIQAETSQGKRVSAYKDNKYSVNNLIKASNLLSASGWSTNSTNVNNTVNGTITNGGLYISDTSTSAGYWNFQPVSFINGHIYYYAVEVNITSFTSLGYYAIIRNSNGSTHTLLADRLTDGYELFSTRITSNENNTTVQLGSSIAGVMTGYARNIRLYDLTANFGKNNEPSKEWCDENLKY